MNKVKPVRLSPKIIQSKLDYLEEKYGIKLILSSAYNSYQLRNSKGTINLTSYLSIKEIALIIEGIILSKGIENGNYN